MADSWIGLIFTPKEQSSGSGSGSSTSSVYGEIPAGQTNQSNKVFTTQNRFQAGSTRVFLNGIRLTLGVDYSENSDSSILFVSAPYQDDLITIDYNKI